MYWNDCRLWKHQVIAYDKCVEKECASAISRNESGLQEKKRKTIRDPGARLSTANESQKNPGSHVSAVCVMIVLSANPKAFLFGFYVLATSNVILK